MPIEHSVNYLSCRRRPANCNVEGTLLAPTFATSMTVLLDVIGTTFLSFEVFQIGMLTKESARACPLWDDKTSSEVALTAP